VAHHIFGPDKLARGKHEVELHSIK